MADPTRPIFLLGMMGAGKTSVGRLLADKRGAEFVDLDERIELMFAATIPALFEHGEAYFRACERAALRSLLAEPGFAGASVIVATGGGIVSDPANLDDMAAHGTLVYLELSPPRLAERLSTPQELARRPLLERGSILEGAEHPETTLSSRLATLLAAREQAYRRAHVIVDGDDAPEQVFANVDRAC